MGEQHLLPGQNEPVPTGQDLRHSNTQLVGHLFACFDCFLGIFIYTLLEITYRYKRRRGKGLRIFLQCNNYSLHKNIEYQYGFNFSQRILLFSNFDHPLTLCAMMMVMLFDATGQFYNLFHQSYVRVTLFVVI